MKRIKTQNLHLSAETVRVLAVVDLTGVAGGITGGRFTQCNTCQISCGTNCTDCETCPTGD